MTKNKIEITLKHKKIKINKKHFWRIPPWVKMI